MTEQTAVPVKFRRNLYTSERVRQVSEPIGGSVAYCTVHLKEACQRSDELMEIYWSKEFNNDLWCTGIKEPHQVLVLVPQDTVAELDRCAKLLGGSREETAAVFIALILAKDSEVCL